MMLSLAQKLHLFDMYYIFTNSPETSMSIDGYLTLSMDINSLLDACLIYVLSSALDNSKYIFSSFSLCLISIFKHGLILISLIKLFSRCIRCILDFQWIIGTKKKKKKSVIWQLSHYSGLHSVIHV